MSKTTINHLSNKELFHLFTFLSTKDLQLVNHRWMNICTTHFPKKYHLVLEDVTLTSFSSPITVFKNSKRIFETLTLSNVFIDYREDSTEVLMFMKRLYSSVRELRLKYSIKANIDLIRGFQKVTKLEIYTPGWYLAIANSKISFPEVRILRLIGFNIEVFGKNMFVSFFKKFSYVEQIEIEGNVMENYSALGTYFGQKLKQIHFEIKNRDLATRTLKFLTIIKGIELRTLNFVMDDDFDADIFDKLIEVHHSLTEIHIISTRGYLPKAHPNIKSCKMSLCVEAIDVFNRLSSFNGLESIEIDFPWKQSHVQVNCFFGHESFEENTKVETLKIRGFNKNCVICFANMTRTYPNLKVFEYISFEEIDFDVIQILGQNLLHLEEIKLVYKNYSKFTDSGFAAGFAEWPSMYKLKKVKLEPISWRWSNDGLQKFCKNCPLLESIEFDGGVDIDDSFLDPIMTYLPHLQYLSIGDTNPRVIDILEMSFLSTEKFECCDLNSIPLESYNQTCCKLRELRLLTCTLDYKLKLRLFENFKMLRTIQDHKTLMTSKQFHELQNKYRTDMEPEQDYAGQSGKLKRFLQNLCC